MNMSTQIQLQEKTNKIAAYLPPEHIWRVTVEQYHAMIASGALTEDNPIELLQGWLVEKMPKKPRHSVVTRLLFDMLVKFLPSGWFVNVQEPITTADSEPEPDLTIVRGSPHDYLAHHPYPQDVALLIEVSDATLSRDQTLKKQLYAQAEIPVYWIVNLPDNQIEAYSQPFTAVSGSDYGQRHTYGLHDQMRVTIAGETIGEISVAQVLIIQSDKKQ